MSRAVEPTPGPHAARLSFEGRTALVIGAGGGGIGTATSLALGQAGASVVAVDFDQDRLDDTEARLCETEATCYPILANVRDVEAVKAVVAEAVDRAGRIDHLVNVAGGNQPGEWWRLEEYPDSVYDDASNLNLRYVFVACREVARHMIAERIAGSIVNFSSVSALGAAPYHAMYGAAKAAVIALTRTMAVEWGQYGIRVNAIVPGSVDTPRTASAPGSWDRSWNPLPRRCQPDDIAGAVLFLLSDLAAMITGQAINVDAGISARSVSGGIERFAAKLGS